MRIIAGEYGGRTLRTPAGSGTRPMLDRVREALFSTLSGRWEGARVLDLFAGCGALGLESLSRGAERARLVELDPRVARLLEQNAAELGAEERADVVRADALAPAAWGPASERFDVVFFDPPYPMVRDGPARRRVFEALERLASERLADGGTIVFHAPRNLLQPGEFDRFDARERPYGTSTLWYLEPRSGKAELA